MPRSNPKSLSGSRTYSSSTHKSTNTSIPSVSPVVPVAPTITQPTKPSIMSSVKDGIASGFGWGIGTSITRSIFGGNVSQNTNIPTTGIEITPVTKCFTETENYKKCTEKFGADFCLNELEFLNKCKETIN